MLVLSDEVPIHEVNLAMRGVVVPAGSHEMRFAYPERRKPPVPEFYAKTVPGN